MDWRCEGLVDSAQRSSALFAVCGGINLCRGSPHRKVFEGGFPGTLELPGLLGNRAVFNSWLAYKIGLDTLSPSGILGRQTMGITEVTAWGGRYAR